MDKKLRNIYSVVNSNIKEILSSNEDKIKQIINIALTFNTTLYNMFDKKSINKEQTKQVYDEYNLFINENYTDILNQMFQVGNDACEFIDEFIKRELQYLYKNYQYVSMKDRVFIAHDSSCNACHFAQENQYVDKDFIKRDTCDSYFVTMDDYMETENIISGSFRVYNVPKIIKRNIISFYKILQLKFDDYIKQDVKITFTTMENNVELSYNKNDNEYVINFSPINYKHYFLKAMLNNVLFTDRVKDLYYNKIQKENVIFASNKFINFLASQNAEEYYIESFVSYILYPQKLQEVDNGIYEYFRKEIEKV